MEKDKKSHATLPGHAEHKSMKLISMGEMVGGMTDRLQGCNSELIMHNNKYQIIKQL